MKQVTTPVISNHEVMPDCYLMWLDSPEIAAEAKPGQFVMVQCGEDTLLRRPLSIHQRDGSKIALLFQVMGKGTAWLSQCKAGDNVDIFGPLGNGFSIYPSSHNLLLVAGGIGTAPLSFLADEALKQDKNITLLMGASSATQLLPTEPSTQGILTDGILPWGITIRKSTDDGSDGYRGLVTELLIEQQHVDWADQIFACGPMPMYRDMVLKMQELKLEGRPVQISLEVRMGCGLGVCYGCTVKTKSGLKQVCKDGPVFELDDILWDELNIGDRR